MADTTNEPKLLVVTPTLGTRNSLEQTILSVRLYGGPSVAHVLVGPSERLSYYKQMYPWVQILEQPQRKGVYPALNHALSTYGASLQYFAYINDDDSWTEGFSQLLETIFNDTSLDVVYGRVLYGSIANIKDIGPFFPVSRWFSLLSSKGIPFITQQALVIKTEIVLNFNCFDENLPLSADSKLWSQVFSSSVSVKAVDSFCAYYELAGEERLSLNPDLIKKDFNVNLATSNVSSSISDIAKIAIYRLYNTPLYLQRLKKLYLS